MATWGKNSYAQTYTINGSELFIVDTGSDTVVCTTSLFQLANTAITLGETSTTAYRGDRGKIAYEHSQLTSNNPHNVTALQVGLGNVTNESKATMFTNPTLTGIVKESITTLTGTSNALVNTNNSIMTWSLTGTSTLTDSLNAGETCSLLLTYNSNSITLPTISWYGGLTTPTNQTKVRFYFEKIGTTLYGSWLSA